MALTVVSDDLILRSKGCNLFKASFMVCVVQQAIKVGIHLLFPVVLIGAYRFLSRPLPGEEEKLSSRRRL